MSRYFSLFVMLVFLLSFTGYSKDEADVKIKSITIERQTTPCMPGGKHGSRGAGEKWLVVEVEIDVKKQDWLKEAEVSWQVLIDGEAETPYELKKKTTFVDLEKGTNVVSAFVRPKFFMRRMKNEKTDTSRIFAVVDVKVNGRTVDRAWKGESSLKKVLEKGEATRRMDNELLPRSKTPFAHVDYDYYADEKIEQKSL